ncbi:MAG TPA: hypothetical protein VGX96_12705 [Candidatus Elarobacter sp.]|jgi:hypothetical protein|nr:hypothetical protein [Candidatus Elarobacter sp.]
MMMRRRSSVLLACTFVLAPLAGGAQSTPPAAMPMSSPTARPAPTAAPSPSAAEAAFIKRVMTNLPKRYPTPQSATAAGWIRYTREDRTGAISYVNTQYWDTTDPDHPAQLWYDVNGRLLGADFSVPQAESVTGPPSRFGIDPSRWFKIPAHVHYVQRNANGTISYGKAIRTDRYAAANNGDYSHPTAAGLVAAKAVTDAASVPFVFLYPAIYDVTVWVVPNPLGQFADANPAVTPSPRAGKGEDDAM